MNNKCCVFLFKMVPIHNLTPECWLDADELSRFKNMDGEKRKIEFLNSRLFIKSIFREIYGIRNPRILKKKNGKPFARGLKFNFSHSQNRIALAVHSEFDLGIDIEKNDQILSYEKIAKKYFSTTEQEYIFSGKAASQRLQRFKLIWALTEACIKATGSAKNRKSKMMKFGNLAYSLALAVKGQIELKDIEIFDVRSTKAGLSKKISQMKLQAII